MPLHSLSSSRLPSPAITDWLDLVDSFLICNWRVKQMKREILLKFSFAWDLFSVFIYMMRGGQEREKAMFYPFICTPQISATAQAGPGWCQETTMQVRSPMWVVITKTLELLTAVFQCMHQHKGVSEVCLGFKPRPVGIELEHPKSLPFWM